MFPNSIVPRLSLHQPVNNFAVSLSANVNGTQTTIPISAKQIGAVQLPASGMVSIGKEIIWYQSINPVGPQLINCVRGYDNTNASPHLAGDRVEVRWVAAHHNTLADLLYTVQVTLGSGILDGAAQLGPGETFSTLASKLSLTLPEIVAISPATNIWSVQHMRRRVVAVQLYEWDAINGVFRLFEAPNMQQVDPVGPGPSMVTIEAFPTPKEGVVVMM